MEGSIHWWPPSPVQNAQLSLTKQPPSLRRRSTSLDHVLRDARLATSKPNLSTSPWMRGARMEFSVHRIESARGRDRALTSIGGTLPFSKTKPLRCCPSLESVRKHQAGLQSFRSMRRIEA